MKKLALFSFAFLCTFMAYAQLEVKPTIGLNVTNVSENPDTGEATGQVGWQVGTSLLFGNKFYFEPGIYYNRKNLEFVSETDEDFNFESDIKGFRVPVAFGIHLLGNQESAVDLRVFGGASGFFITSVEAGIYDEDDFKSPEWGTFIGAGLDFLFLFADVKYEWSLTESSSIQNFDVGQRRSIFFNVGIRF